MPRTTRRDAVAMSTIFLGATILMGLVGWPVLGWWAWLMVPGSLIATAVMLALVGLLMAWVDKPDRHSWSRRD